MSTISESMSKALNRMTAQFGDKWGRARWAWLMQKYNVMPWDECPREMKREVYYA